MMNNPDTPAAPPPARLPAFLKTAFRILFGLALAAILVAFTLRANGTRLSQVLPRASIPLLATALGVYGLVILITVARWNILLRVQGIHLHPWEVIRLTMIGVFFNLAIPGAVGGDLIKMGYVARQTPGKRTEAILTILLDRIIGLLALFMVAAVMVLASLPVLQRISGREPAVAASAYLVGAGSIAGILATLAIEYRRLFLRLRPVAAAVAWAARIGPAGVVHTVERVVAALELYRTRRRSVLAALALAFAVHSLLSIDYFLIGRAIGEQRLTLGNYFLTTQIANAAGAIPVTPSGIGARDGVASLFFRTLGGDPQLCGAIPVLLSVIMVFWSMVGAVIFMFSKGIRQAWIEDVTRGQTPETPNAGTR